MAFYLHLNPDNEAICKICIEGKRNNIIAHMRASDILVGIDASCVVSPKKCKLLCDRLAKTEDIVVLALVYDRASTSKALSHAVWTS